MRLEFTIPVAPRTKKNHSQIVYAHGRPMIIPSKQYKQYVKDASVFVPRLPEPISTPVNVEYHFYMPTRRKCDLVNLIQSANDLLVECGLLLDDNFTVVESHDYSRVHYDKNNPRTEVVIEGEEDV